MNGVHERVGDLSPYLLRKLWEESSPEKSTEMFDTWSKFRKELPTKLFEFSLLLGLNLTEKAHRRICDEFFPKLNPDVPMEEFFQKEDRLLFAPRDSYKSSVASAYDVATICVYPDCKLAVQSAKQTRAADHIEDAKHYFIAETDPDGNFILNRFQALWPEHCIAHRERGAYGVFSTPARKRWAKESTIDNLSIDESRSGGHWHRGRSDDIATDGNCGADSTPEARANLGKRLLESRNLFGTCLYLGTPYTEDDPWSVLQESLGDSLNVLILPAWEVKPASATKAEADRQEADMDLLFCWDRSGKTKLTFKVLCGFQRANPESFKTQQLCQATKQKRVHITEGMVRGHILPGGYASFERSPVVSTWDLGYALDNRDFSVGSAGFKDSMKGAILLDSVRGRWNKPDLCRVMAEQAARLRVQIIFIEDSQGARWLEDDIKKELQEIGAVTSQIVYFTVSTEPNAKQIRFEDIHNALKADQLWFSADIPKAQLDYIAHELSHFKYRVQRQRDDLSDSIGHLLNKLEEPIETAPAEQPASPAQLILVQKQLRDLVYGTTDSPKDRPDPEPAYGYRTEQLKEELVTEWEGQPVFKSAEDYLYQSK
jgi:predicted phage terminase large subunit-like protein